MVRGRLAERRKAVGLSQEGLAESLGVDRSTIVRWERGTARPQPWLRPRLASALHVSIRELADLLDDTADAAASAEAARQSTAPAWDGSGVQTMHRFRHADPRLGGEFLYDDVLAYLRLAVAPRLFDVADGDTAPLFAAAAGLTEMAGWMAYDSGLTVLAGRHFHRAFEFARTSGNRDLGAHILASLSHLAHHDRQPTEGIRYAERGLNLLRGEPADAGVDARLHAMLARGHAAHRDAAQCDASIDTAQRLLQQPLRATTSPWPSMFDRGSLAIEKARCYQQLGRLSRARAATASAIAARAPDRIRSRAFAQLTAVSTMIEEGSLDEACAMAGEVVDVTRTLGSQLVLRQLEGLLPRLAPYADNRDVAAFLDRLRGRLSQRHRPPERSS
ncbi:hypothetical protein Cme02nite_70250 [Catellatospora methionotrophica]|uniref:HTH cro/C1-type domain-containing protein n=2 Tax=Catellatospora methionotrophica TaxID=121620 RepID=A0A8J3PJP6_9ACTN|nr:helix-turn-helix transcriptional regulator [Catellatospora methionotrophica]GIG18693.1 hypothetical protein Cme02nite_70250 [Catellatospora methionotrophica]